MAFSAGGEKKLLFRTGSLRRVFIKSSKVKLFILQEILSAIIIAINDLSAFWAFFLLVSVF